MKTVVFSLSQGRQTLVDESDAALLGAHPWHAVQCSGKWYARRSYSENGRVRGQYLHRALMGAKAGQIVDHIDGDTLNNTRENLRVTTHSINNLNQPARKSRSGVRGAALKNGKYIVRIGGIYAGVFEDRDEAAFEANALILSIDPQCSHLNEIDYDRLKVVLRRRMDAISEQLERVEAASDR